MSPNQFNQTGILNEIDEEVDTKLIVYDQKPREYKFRWKNVIYFTIMHISAIYGAYLAFTSAKILTTLHAYFLTHVGLIGLTAGVHRLWAHRSYKVKTPLKVLLVIMQTLGFHNSILIWVRNHRVHHKFSDTDADPHNANRGLFYSHIGWLLLKLHPDAKAKAITVDISDIRNDALIRFQHKYYIYLALLISFVIPILVPMYFWNELFINAWYLNFLRHFLTLHQFSLINSLAHAIGNKPYDRYIKPTDNVTVSLFATGEGWHNYHHTFPWDYKTSELGKYSYITNLSTAFIDFFAKIGWAYDLKTVSEDMIKRRVGRTGDGSHNVWGWNDKDMLPEDINNTIVINKEIKSH